MKVFSANLKCVSVRVRMRPILPLTHESFPRNLLFSHFRESFIPRKFPTIRYLCWNVLCKRGHPARILRAIATPIRRRNAVGSVPLARIVCEIFRIYARSSMLAVAVKRKYYYVLYLMRLEPYEYHYRQCRLPRACGRTVCVHR